MEQKVESQAAGGGNPLLIRLETPADYHAAEEVSREAFWAFWNPAKKICSEPLLVHRLRSTQSYVPEMDFVAELDGRIVGHIIYSKAAVTDDAGQKYEVLTFGPLAVLPEYQSRGIGQALLRHSMAEAKRLGYRAILFFGFPDYYPRVGFRRSSEFGITADGHNSDSFIAYPLYDGALDGVQGQFSIDPAYDNLIDEDSFAYDKQFPPKELFIATPIGVLLEQLEPAARKSIEGLGGPTRESIKGKSEYEISSLPGIDGEALETFRRVMHAHGVAWGESKKRHE